jgi:hypothetical protein
LNGDVISCNSFTGVITTASPFKEAGARIGDYWVDDSVYGFIFRVENGVVTKLWSND